MNECGCETCENLTKESIENISRLFNIEFKDLREDIFIQGSPERCVSRTVFEDSFGELYIIENISDEMYENKIKIARTLEYLNTKGLDKITPYMSNDDNKSIVRYNETYYQIMPYIKGFELKRPDFIRDSWRGEALADFLIQLKEKSHDIEKEIITFDKENPFSMDSYVYLITETVKEHDSEYFKQITPITEYLKKRLFTEIKKIPIAFSHGDFHPINVIWGEEKINSVIDWEFIGFKPEIYDVSNLIGCIGIENPNALTGELVNSFIRRIKTEELINNDSWNYLVDFIIANRFAWLSEWFRKKDIEMIDLEITYMNILMQNRDKLTEYWKGI